MDIYRLFTPCRIILGSTRGSIGSVAEDASSAGSNEREIPYLTPENKQQVAKALWNADAPLATDFFETADYVWGMHHLLEQGSNVLGNDYSQRLFWLFLFILRGSIYYRTLYGSPALKKEKGLIWPILLVLFKKANLLMAQDPQKARNIIKDVILYEQTHPYTMEQALQQRINAIESISLQHCYLKEFALLGTYLPCLKTSNNDLMELFAQADFSLSSIILSPKDIPEAEAALIAVLTPDMLEAEKQREISCLQRFSSEIFQKNRQAGLQSLQEDTAPRNDAETPLELKILQKADTESYYDIGFTAPANFPAELFFADFLLDDTENAARLSIRPLNAVKPGEWTFTKYNFSATEKRPFPHRIDLVWYSVAENKSYSLQAALPLQKIQEFIAIQRKDSVCNFVFGLAPFGVVALWAQHSRDSRIVELAHFQAQPIELPFETFSQAGTSYQTANWEEYRATVLKGFPQAQQYLAQHSLPAPETFWQFQTRYQTAFQIKFSKPQERLHSFYVRYFNGESEILDEKQLSQYAARAKPKEIMLRYVENEKFIYAVYLYVPYQDAQDNAASHACYQTVLGNDPNAKGNLVLAFDESSHSWTLSLRQGDNAQQIPMEELIFRDNELCYKSPVFYQPQTKWKESKKPPKEIPLEKRNEALAQALAQKKEEDVNRLLPAEGIDPNYQTPDRGTLLTIALSSGNMDWVKKLIALGADVNLREKSSGYTPLMVAATTNQPDLIKLLLDSGADLHAKRILHGYSIDANALSVAISFHSQEAEAALRAAGASETSSAHEISPQQPHVPPTAELPQNAAQTPPLISAILCGDKILIQQLIESGADVNAADAQKKTPLVYACTVGDTETAQKLIQAGACVDVRDETGLSPLLLACTQGNASLVRLLIDAGANVELPFQLNGSDSDLTPIKMAENAGSEDIVAMLKQAGATK